MRAYEVILHGQAWSELVKQNVAEKHRLVGLLGALSTTPFRPGDYQQYDTTGRSNEVRLVGEWLVTFWADHAAREIRVVNLERVED